MRLRPYAETSLKAAITRIAEKNPDLRMPKAQDVLLQLCRKCYRLGVSEMQEDIEIELGRSMVEDFKKGEGYEQGLTISEVLDDIENENQEDEPGEES